MAIGLLLVLVLTLFVFRLPVFESLKLLWGGAFGDSFALSRTAVKATPLILCAVGMVVAWRAGMYNIGGEGQFVMGGLLAAVVAKSFPADTHLPGLLVALILLSASIIGGGLWGWFAGWLQVKRGVQVVISTILLNFIALQILGYLISGPLQEAKHQLPLTDTLPDAWMLPKLTRQLDLHLGMVLCLVITVVVYLFLYLTRTGFKMRVVGNNPFVARSNKISTNFSQLLAMLISGGLCGLAGGIEYVGLSGQIGSGFSQNWGFLGIPVALLSGLHPLAVIPSGLYFGALFAGSENLARFTPAGTTLIYIIQGAAVFGFVLLRSYEKPKPVGEPT